MQKGLVPLSLDQNETNLKELRKNKRTMKLQYFCSYFEL